MSEWGKRNLMSWDEFNSTFKPYFDRWEKIHGGDINIEYQDYWRVILKSEGDEFGKEIEVRKRIITNEDYNYIDKNHNLYHELWFESEFKSIEFITEEEFMV